MEQPPICGPAARDDHIGLTAGRAEKMITTALTGASWKSLSKS
jgi:hypothetical protein